MTTYGTIQTAEAPPSANFEFVSRAKDRIRSGMAARRPWREMVHLRALTLPPAAEAFPRLRANAAYFRMNYALLVLLVLFLSLLWHPVSLIVLAAMMAAWLFLYFCRDQPLAVFGRTVDDRVVLFVLSVLTLVFLFLTNATTNILVALLIGAALVLAHALLRRTDDLFADEESGIAPPHGREGYARMPLREAASASFSS